MPVTCYVRLVMSSPESLTTATGSAASLVSSALATVCQALVLGGTSDDSWRLNMARLQGAIKLDTTSPNQLYLSLSSQADSGSQVFAACAYKLGHQRLPTSAKVPVESVSACTDQHVQTRHLSGFTEHAVRLVGWLKHVKFSLSTGEMRGGPQTHLR